MPGELLSQNVSKICFNVKQMHAWSVHNYVHLHQIIKREKKAWAKHAILTLSILAAQMLWCTVYSLLLFVTSSLAWTYHVMIGSWRDNNLANYREDHCQEEQGNGTVHLSMTIMPVKKIVIEFSIVTTIMIIITMVPTTMTTKRLWGNIHGNTEGNNNNVAWYFTSRLTLILFMLWRTKKSPGTDRVTMIRPVIQRWGKVERK